MASTLCVGIVLCGFTVLVIGRLRLSYGIWVALVVFAPNYLVVRVAEPVRISVWVIRLVRPSPSKP